MAESSKTPPKRPPGQTRWAQALQDADVVLRARPAGHGEAMWREEFPLIVAWAFRG